MKGKREARKLVVWAQPKDEPFQKSWYIYQKCATRRRAEQLAKSLRAENGKYFAFKVGGLHDEPQNTYK